MGWKERQNLECSSRKISRTLYYIYIFFFLRIHRHSKNGDENSGPVEGRGTRIRARALSRGHTIVLVTIFTFHISTDIALLFKPPLRRRLVNTLDIHLTLSQTTSKTNKNTYYAALLRYPALGAAQPRQSEASSTPREWLAWQTSAGRDFWTWQWRMAGRTKLDFYT